MATTTSGYKKIFVNPYVAAAAKKSMGTDKTNWCSQKVKVKCANCCVFQRDANPGKNKQLQSIRRKRNLHPKPSILFFWKMQRYLQVIPRRNYSKLKGKEGWRESPTVCHSKSVTSYLVSPKHITHKALCMHAGILGLDGLRQSCLELGNLFQLSSQWESKTGFKALTNPV